MVVCESGVLKIRRRRVLGRLPYLMSLCLWMITVPSVRGGSENGDAPRTWKTVNELPVEELEQVDLRTDTPRRAEYPYLPAEPYPFTAPYTAEEMGLSHDGVHSTTALVLRVCKPFWVDLQ